MWGELILYMKWPLTNWPSSCIISIKEKSIALQKDLSYLIKKSEIHLILVFVAFLTWIIKLVGYLKTWCPIVVWGRVTSLKPIIGIIKLLNGDKSEHKIWKNERKNYIYVCLLIGKNKSYTRKNLLRAFHLKCYSSTEFDFIHCGIYSFTYDFLHALFLWFKVLRLTYKSLEILFTRVVYSIYSI